MSTKHTPGALRLTDGHIVAADGMGLISMSRSSAENEANKAHLVQCWNIQPDLLAACKHALARLAFADPTKQPTGRPAPAEDQGAFVHLEDAIAKAEGRSE